MSYDLDYHMNEVKKLIEKEARVNEYSAKGWEKFAKYLYDNFYLPNAPKSETYIKAVVREQNEYGSREDEFSKMEYHIIQTTPMRFDYCAVDYVDENTHGFYRVIAKFKTRAEAEKALEELKK